MAALVCHNSSLSFFFFCLYWDVCYPQACRRVSIITSSVWDSSFPQRLAKLANFKLIYFSPASHRFNWNDLNLHQNLTNLKDKAGDFPLTNLTNLLTSYVYIKAWYIVFLCAVELSCFPKTIRNTSYVICSTTRIGGGGLLSYFTLWSCF